MQSILFDRFVIQAGTDESGVSTGMVTMNSTVKMIFRNKGTFFGVHVTSTPLDLSLAELTLASGTVSNHIFVTYSRFSFSIPKKKKEKNCITISIIILLLLIFFFSGR